MNTVSLFLKENLFSQISMQSQTWIRSAMGSISSTQKSGHLYTFFSLASRYLSRDQFVLTHTSKADFSLPILQSLSKMSQLQAGRLLLLLSTPLTTEEGAYPKLLDDLYETADVEEMVTLQKALPFLPFPHTHLVRAGQGLRSSIDSVFLAIAHHNPYPANYLDEISWNHMVLKTLFIGQSLLFITHLPTRHNESLKKMLLDHFQERKAASRPVNPQIWQCIAPFLKESEVNLLDKLASQGTLEEKKAAFLCLSQQSGRQAQQLLQKLKSQSNFNYESLTWESIHHESI